ncbi:hypothetical protein WMY93_008784 [Mugilogobius chulae]|uniref:TTF-type domain-containing protein n=1 Tax=Mugilogobius chulae TaxID=88201 RepID=A0AAW0PEZ2_9GOBI
MKRSAKPSGAAFRKRRKEAEEKRVQSRDAIRKYLQPQPEPAPEGATETTSCPGTSSSITVDEAQQQDPDEGPSTSTVMTTTTNIQQLEDAPTSVCESVEANPIDPADWPSLSDNVRTELVNRGPFSIKSDFSFPKKEDGRSFHHHFFNRHLTNGEKIKRTWLMYSPKNDSLYCFPCKLFSQKAFKLSRDGLNDWKNCGDILKIHETSSEHCKTMNSWKELESRLKSGQTIDKVEIELINTERRRWREVLTRLVAIIQSLAARNIALRGTSEKLHQPNNGNFLKEVELMAQFDPVLKEHVAKVERGASHTTYLGKTIQNEIIDCIGKGIVESIVNEIKLSKYFSIILDCTPDLSHREQMSVVIRIVTVEGSPEIKEHFLGFLEAEESTGESLSALILKTLDELKIPFEDCRGQSYDNGANMKGKRKGVQARLQEINRRALFVPCGAHTVNLVVSDAARSSTDASSYFGDQMGKQDQQCGACEIPGITSERCTSRSKRQYN